MNIQKTNKIGLIFAQKGVPLKSFTKKATEVISENGYAQQKILIKVGSAFGDDNQAENTVNIPLNLVLKERNQKVFRLSKNVIENAKLINVESVKRNCDSIDFNLSSYFILLDNDESGFIKVVRFGSDLFFDYMSNLSGEIATTINAFNFISKSFILPEDDRSKFVLQVLTYLFFGEITDRFIKAKNTLCINASNRIVNNSQTDIVFVDTLWKERISTEGFIVRGHFRLQPIGESRQNRKLIWIEEFEKSGYNRKSTRELTNHE